MKSFLARRKEVVYLGDLSLVENKNLWSRLMDRKNMNCFKIFSPIDKNEQISFWLKTLSFPSKKESVIDISSKNAETPFEKKERLKEIGVHEKYLERFIKELL